ncbi:MAG: FAD-dependent monooxygenase, partial [Burkholderiales bacterium]
MRIAVIGAGPAGLLFSYLVKRRFPGWQIDVFDQNPAEATFGFGVVFSQGALGFLERDAPDLHRQLATRMQSWPMQRIVHRDTVIDIDGNGFSAIARLALNRFLQALCAEVGVSMAFGREIRDLGSIGGADLIVGADGVNSLVRH